MPNQRPLSSNPINTTKNHVTSEPTDTGTERPETRAMAREPLPFQYPDSTSPGAEHDTAIVKMIDEGHSWADIETVAGENAFDRYYNSLDPDLGQFWTRETITRLNKVVEEQQSTTATTETPPRSLSRGIRDGNVNSLPWEKIAAALDSRASICRKIWTMFGDGRPLSATELALVIAEKEEKEKKKKEEQARIEAKEREMARVAQEERKRTRIATKAANMARLGENVALDHRKRKRPRVRASASSSSSSSSSRKALGLDIPATSFCDRNHNSHPTMLSPPPSASSSPMDQHFERHLINDSGNSSFSSTSTRASLGHIFNSDPSLQCDYQGTRQERARRLVRLQRHKDNAKLLAKAVQQKRHQEELYHRAVQGLLNARKILSPEHKWRLQAVASTGLHTHPSLITPDQLTRYNSSTTSPLPLVIHDSSAEQNSVLNTTSTESAVIELTEGTSMGRDMDMDMDMSVDVEEPVAPEPSQSVLFPQHKPTGLVPLPNTNPYYDVLTWTAEDISKTWQSWGQMGDNWEYISTRVLQDRHSPQACRAFVMGAGII